MQLQYTETIETAQLGAPQRRAAVDAKVEEVAIVEQQVGKPDVWNSDKKRTSMTRREDSNF